MVGYFNRTIIASLNCSYLRFQWQHHGQVTSVGSELLPNKERNRGIKKMKYFSTILLALAMGSVAVLGEAPDTCFARIKGPPRKVKWSVCDRKGNPIKLQFQFVNFTKTTKIQIFCDLIPMK